MNPIGASVPWLLFCALAAVGGPARAAPYVITPIAQEAGAITELFLANKQAAINNAGVVAFSADVPSVSPSATIYTGTGGALTQIDTNASPFVSINSAGAVVSGGWPTINDTGQVSYASLGTIYRRDPGGGADIPVASDVPGVTFVGGPAMNGAGIVAYAEAVVAEGSTWRRWYRGAGGAPTLIADASGPISGQGIAGYPAIDDQGFVYFSARLDSGEFAIFAGDGVQLRTIVDSAGAFSAFGEISVDRLGHLAFRGFLDDGTEGLFRQVGSDFEEVIADGDALLGSTIGQLHFFQEGLNDGGQMAFGYTLVDGRRGIARADPVPEPGTLVLVALGLALIRGQRHRCSETSSRGAFTGPGVSNGTGADVYTIRQVSGGGRQSAPRQGP